MKILLVNAEFEGGGAEKVARQLFEKLPKYENIQTYFLSGKKTISRDQLIFTVYDNKLKMFMNRFRNLFTNNARKRNKATVKMVKKIVELYGIDIIHLHNIHGNYFGIEDLRIINELCPIVWTLHDLWVITGHCAYPVNCNKNFSEECKRCSNLSYYPKMFYDNSHNIYNLKKSSFKKLQGMLISPSEWLIKECKKSYLNNEEMHLINNGVNLDIYLANNKEEMRRKYNLVSDKLILMFSAHSIKSEYKGFEILLQALNLTKRKNEIILMVVGAKIPKYFKKEFELVEKGYIRDEKEMNELYSLSDIFVLPSVAENYPCSVLESMASGTPVIASNVGGIAEQINEETGWLFENRNATNLAYTIEYLLDNKAEIVHRGESARKRMEEKSEKDMVHKYAIIYNKCMNTK